MSAAFPLEESEELAARIFHISTRLGLPSHVKEHAMRFMRALQARASDPEVRRCFLWKHSS
jgi:hypothetical protein